MARVFKRGKKWYARYRDAEGNERKEAGFTDKTATLQPAVKREHEADLVRKGLLAAPQPHRDRSLPEDLTAFRSALSNKDVTASQVDLVVVRCERVCDGCGFGTVGGIDAVEVEDWLARMGRKGTRRRSGSRSACRLQTTLCER
jgi:hypothetical protein